VFCAAPFLEVRPKVGTEVDAPSLEGLRIAREFIFAFTQGAAVERAVLARERRMFKA
jgi:hypothetical protein